MESYGKGSSFIYSWFPHSFVGLGLGTTWMLCSFAKAFSEGGRNAASVDMQLCSNQGITWGEQNGRRQAWVVETKAALEGRVCPTWQGGQSRGSGWAQKHELCYRSAT